MRFCFWEAIFPSSGGPHPRLQIRQHVLDLLQTRPQLIRDFRGQNMRIRQARRVLQSLITRPEDIQVRLVARDALAVLVFAPAAFGVLFLSRRPSLVTSPAGTARRTRRGQRAPACSASACSACTGADRRTIRGSSTASRAPACDRRKADVEIPLQTLPGATGDCIIPRDNFLRGVLPKYNYTGPNSNTFAVELLGGCGYVPNPPRGVKFLIKGANFDSSDFSR